MCLPLQMQRLHSSALCISKARRLPPMEARLSGRCRRKEKVPAAARRWAATHYVWLDRQCEALPPDDIKQLGGRSVRGIDIHDRDVRLDARVRRVVARDPLGKIAVARP